MTDPARPAAGIRRRERPAVPPRVAAGHAGRRGRTPPLGGRSRSAGVVARERGLAGPTAQAVARLRLPVRAPLPGRRRSVSCRSLATVVGQVLSAPGPIGLAIRIASVVVVRRRSSWPWPGRRVRSAGRERSSIALVDQAARVEGGDYSARVETRGPARRRSAPSLAAFNTMAARLEADEAQRRTLLADVTHELRTPLAVVQGSVEAILDGVHPADDVHLGAILEETRVLDRLIEDLRTLAPLGGGCPVPPSRADRSRDRRDRGVRRRSRPRAAAAGVELATTVDDELPLLDIDPVRMREVVGNLVGERAPPHAGRRPDHDRGSSLARAPPTDRSRSSCPTRARGSTPICCRTSSTALPGAPGRPAAGSGLAIARGLVELHGGTIEAISPAGGGTTIRIRLASAPVD